MTLPAFLRLPTHTPFKFNEEVKMKNEKLNIENEQNEKNNSSFFILHSPFFETPHDILLQERDWEFYAMKDMLSNVEGEPVRDPAKWFDIYYRFAAPWAGVILVLFAIPTGLTTSRQGTIKGIISSLVIFFGFFVLTLICKGLGQAGTLFSVMNIPIALPPLIAAWITNVIGIIWVANLYRKMI